MTYCLIVDDSSVIRKVARRIIEGFGFQVTEARDGEQALEQCRLLMPDVILLDHLMPGIDGHEVLKTVRSMPEGKRPKIVFCTTENDLAPITRAMRSGATDYMLKPFDRPLVEAKFQDVGII